MICCTGNVIENTLLISVRTCIVVIDYSKACNSVSHIQIFNIHNDMGCPRHIVALIHAMYFVPEDGRRNRGRPKKTWPSNSKKT